MSDLKRQVNRVSQPRQRTGLSGAYQRPGLSWNMRDQYPYEGRLGIATQGHYTNVMLVDPLTDYPSLLGLATQGHMEDY